jgi:hypothetical protein
MTGGAQIIRSFYGPDQINVSVEQTGLQRRRPSTAHVSAFRTINFRSCYDSPGAYVPSSASKGLLPAPEWLSQLRGSYDELTL